MSNLEVYRNTFFSVAKSISSTGNIYGMGARWFLLEDTETNEEVKSTFDESVTVYKKLTGKNLYYVIIDCGDKRGVCSWPEPGDGSSILFVDRALKEALRGISGEEDDAKLEQLYSTFLDDGGFFKGIKCSDTVVPA